ncbi:MAG: ribonuclease H-like domain-containing protein [Candidatus Heimdallarchaeota archaeon]|nr:ribonuclease H-like domain-containing protein [Candidatus Heimdallarchaeota archaeon]
MTLVEKVDFMLIDIDYKMDETDESPTIRLFGKSENNVIIVLVKDFLPYFYITKKKLLQDFLANDSFICSWVKKIEETNKKKYFGGEELRLIKIFGSNPRDTSKIKQKLEKAGYDVHEADIPFVKRFLLDTRLRGLNILSVIPDNITRQGNQLHIEACYQNITINSQHCGNSAEHFYKLKQLAFDIEVDHQTETIQQLLAEKNKRITAISYVWGTNQFSHQNKIYLLNEDSDLAEKKIIEYFIDTLQKIQPDIIITFNGDNFDIPYLLARMEYLQIPTKSLSLFQDDSVFYSQRSRCYRIKGRIVYDISPRTWRIHPISGKKSLGDIAEVVLGKKKIEIDKPLGVIWRLGYLENNHDYKKLFKKYSQRDSLLTYELAWKLGVPGWLEVIRLTGYPPGEAPGSTERIQGEFELMRFARQQGVLIPSAPSDEEVARRKIERYKNPHTGGTVLVPKGTIHLAVIITDFRSMYPSVCVSHNIGGETLKHVKELDNANPLELFHSKPQSCLALMQETLINRREETKQKIKDLNQKISLIDDKRNYEKLFEELQILDKEQYSLKIVANSMYGAHNYIRSRFYSITLGNAITNIARTYILRMEKLLTEISDKITPVEIIYGDTDSAFIKIFDSSIVTNIYNEIEPKKIDYYTERLMKLTDSIIKYLNSKFPGAMELTLEDIAYKLIFKPKRAKAYSYYSILTGKLNITGFEAVRSDWSALSRDAQRRVLELILTEPITSTSPNISPSEDPGLIKAKKYLVKLGIEILQMSITDLLSKVVILSPIKKAPKDYKVKTPTVQAFLDFAKKENLDLEESWKEYDKFPWVITPGVGLISDRAKHPKYVKEIDREYYITEILRASEGFGVQLSLQEIKNALTIEPIDEIFKRISKDRNMGKEDQYIDEYEIKRKNKQTKISAFFERD